MSLKHAVLALVVERRGHGYDLVRRFEERIGPGWRLNPSAVYPALDQLERAGLVTGAPRPGGTRRSTRVVYTATPAGAAALDAWIETADTRLEPVRAELHLKLAFAHGEHRHALLAQLAAQEREGAELLARCAATSRTGAPDEWTRSARELIDAGVLARLRTDLAWLRAARTALAPGARF